MKKTGFILLFLLTTLFASAQKLGILTTATMADSNTNVVITQYDPGSGLYTSYKCPLNLIKNFIAFVGNYPLATTIDSNVKLLGHSGSGPDSAYPYPLLAATILTDTPAALNIYNTNGTLTANRLLQFNLYNLEFYTNAGSFFGLLHPVSGGDTSWNFSPNEMLLRTNYNTSLLLTQNTSTLAAGQGFFEINQPSASVCVGYYQAGTAFVNMNSTPSQSRIVFGVHGSDLMAVDSAAQQVQVTSDSGLYVNGYRFPLAAGSNGNTIITDGSGHLSFGNPVFTVVAQADSLAQTIQKTLATYTTPSIGTFEINGYINVTAIATDVINFKIIFTDENSVNHTINFSSISTTGYYPFTSGGSLRVKSGTTITTSVGFTTGGGTVIYDAGSTIIQTQNN